MYGCIYVHTLHTFVHTNMHAYMHTYIYTPLVDPYMHVSWKHTCFYMQSVCLFICRYVRMYVRTYIYACIDICKHTCLLLQKDAWWMHACACMYLHVCRHPCLFVPVYQGMYYSCMYVRMYAYMYVHNTICIVFIHTSVYVSTFMWGNVYVHKPTFGTMYRCMM